MAGQGSTVCYSFEQIAYVLKQAKHSNRIGVCFDTCHAFAAGYDFRDATNYQIMWKAFDTIIGRKKLKAIHLNDSKKEIGSRVDRHEEIGKGQLGLEAFRLLMNDEHLFDIPKILETPQDDLADYEKNMKILMGLLSKETRKKLGL
jgi:deoxyribonuclease-4